jgi:hypothetical protein
VAGRLGVPPAGGSSRRWKAKRPADRFSISFETRKPLIFFGPASTPRASKEANWPPRPGRVKLETGAKTRYRGGQAGGAASCARRIDGFGPHSGQRADFL